MQRTWRGVGLSENYGKRLWKRWGQAITKTPRGVGLRREWVLRGVWSSNRNGSWEVWSQATGMGLERCGVKQQEWVLRGVGSSNRNGLWEVWGTPQKCALRGVGSLNRNGPLRGVGSGDRKNPREMRDHAGNSKKHSRSVELGTR